MISGLSHPVSEWRLRMSMMDRAAQVSPFAALTDYDVAVKETARLLGKELNCRKRYSIGWMIAPNTWVLI